VVVINELALFLNLDKGRSFGDEKICGELGVHRICGDGKGIMGGNEEVMGEIKGKGWKVVFGIKFFEGIC